MLDDQISDLDGVANVLLAAPSMGRTREACSSLLTEGFDAPNVLFVSFTRGAADCVSQWDDLGAEERSLGVIVVGDGGGQDVDDDVEVRSVGAASDLTGLGIEIGQSLSETDGPTTVCFDSLTAMLQYVDFETAFEFLHTISGQFQAAGDVRAHFHLDPQAHTDHEVAAVTSLVDARLDLDGDDVAVRSRDLV